MTDGERLQAELTASIGIIRRLTAEIERLRHDWAVACKDLGEARAEIADLKSANILLHGLIENRDADIERLREEVATWRSRYDAERKDHEATMKAWDEERSGL